MMTAHFRRTLSALVVGLGFASFSASAAPLPADAFAGGSGVAPLGLPDRDVVRDPYSALMSSRQSFSARSLGIVAPHVAFGLPPGLTRAAAVNGSPSGVPFAGPPALGGGPGSSNSGGSSTGSNSPALPATSPLIGANPMPPTAAQDLVVAAQAVPEGGASAILLSAAVLSIYALRRRFA